MEFKNVITLEYTKKDEYYDIQHIFVLAGGQLKNGIVNEWVKDRLDLAIKIYSKNTTKQIITIYCIGGGTYHKPPILNKYGFVIHESTSCADYLIKNGVNPLHIKKEWSSYDTIGNGFFSFTHFINPLQINKSKSCIITSEFHMPRAKAIFTFFNTIFTNNQKEDFIYLASTDNNMDHEFLELRKERELSSLNNFNKQMKDITNVTSFLNWFYTKHKAYSSIMIESDVKHKSKEEINDLVKNSY